MINQVKESEFTLILNACEGDLQIIILGNTRIYVSESWNIEHQATEILAPQLKNIIKTLGITISNIKRIACVVGPGSFTGIRLILTTALGLTRINQALLAEINYLQALALELNLHLKLLPKSTIWATTHARRDLLHVQKYLVSTSGVEPEGEVFLSSPLEFLPLIQDHDYVCGSGLIKSQVLQSLSQSNLRSEIVKPSSLALAWLARRAVYKDQDLEPLYVRSCDAIENLARLSQKQGLNPEASFNHLENRLQSVPQSEI